MDNDFCDKGTLHLLVKGEDGKWAVRVQKLFQDSRSPLWCFGYPYMRKVWDWVILKVMQELFWCQKSNTYYGNILQDAAACNTCIVDYLKKKKKKPKTRIAYLQGKKITVCLEITIFPNTFKTTRVYWEPPELKPRHPNSFVLFQSLLTGISFISTFLIQWIMIHIYSGRRCWWPQDLANTSPRHPSDHWITFIPTLCPIIFWQSQKLISST